MEDTWNSLDTAAIANLGKHNFPRFQKYKEDLYSRGIQWEDDAELILRGYIWDESEDLYLED